VEQGPTVRLRNWLEKQVEKEAKGDVLSFPDRMGQIAAVALNLVAIAFVAIHHTRPTGFFTDEFGTLAAVLLYAVLIVVMVPLFVRLIVGRKNPARLFEMGTNVVFFVAMLYLLVVFPFDFSHFAEPLPRWLEFLLEWVPALLAKWVLAIGIIVSAVMPMYTYLVYRGVKGRLSEPKLERMEKV
jgi:cytochrome bd-type quinol oxidase subunit 2